MRPTRQDLPFRERLAVLLEEDHRKGCLVFSRGGKVSRQHYTRLLGVVASNAGPHQDLFRTYEELLGSTSPETSARVVAARKWLDAALADGTLLTRNGKISREQVSQAAGCALITLVRDQGLKRLIDDYERKVRQAGYVSLPIAVKVQEIRAFLEGSLPTNRSGFSINRNAVAKAVGLPVASLARKPYSPILAEFDELLSAKNREDPYTAKGHGRLYRFEALLDHGWEDRAVKGVTQAMTVGIEDGRLTRSLAKGAYLTGLSFMRHLADQEDQDSRQVVRCINGGMRLEPQVLENAAWRYRGRLAGRSAKVIEAESAGLTNFLACLASEGLVPELERRLSLRRGERSIRHKPTLVEARGLAQESGNISALAAELLEKAAARYNVDLEGAESSEFVETLASEVHASGASAVDNPVQAITEVLRKRLRMIQQAARREVARWREHYQEGQKLLASAEDISCWTHIFEQGSQHDYKAAMRELFPKGQDAGQRGVVNLLAIATASYSGLLPSKSQVAEDLGAFFQKRYLEFGGFLALDAYLRPHNDAVMGALTDYLVESGANIAVGRTLFSNSVEESDLDGHSRVTGVKARAKGKPIIVDLETDAPCVQNLTWLVKASSPVRSAAAEAGDRGSLFLVRHADRCQVPTEFTYCNYFKKLVSGIAGLSGLALTPQMIRPSVLLLRALENDGRIRVGMAIGQHGEMVSQGYQQRLPVRMIYDAAIRQFMDRFETLVIHDSSKAIEFVGRDPGEVSIALTALRRTGLGTFCRNSHGKPGNCEQACRSVDCWDDCPQMLFVADAASIAAVQIWHQSLRSNQGDWERDHPERWEKVWLPWLCFTVVVEEKMVRGPLIKTWNAGTALRQQIEAHPGFRPPTPW